MSQQLSKQYTICDHRPIKEFKDNTFNGYKKAQIFSELQKNILAGNIEKALLWSTELHCSCYVKQLYNKLFTIYIKHVNKNNICMLEQILYEFRNLNTLLESTNVLDLRNNQYLRNHINNMVILLIHSPKYRLPTLPKIPAVDYDMRNIKHLIMHKNLNIIKNYLKPNDNKNIIVPINEIIYNLRRPGISKSLENCLYWLNWIVTYGKNYHKGHIACSDRLVAKVSKKFTNDFTWILWDIILDLLPDDTFIGNLYELYKMDFCKGKKASKLNLIIFAFIIIIDPVPNIIYDFALSDEHEISRIKIMANINVQYLDIIYNTPTTIPTTPGRTPSVKRPVYVKEADTNSIFSKNNFKAVKNIDKVINKFMKTPEKSNSILVNSKAKKVIVKPKKVTFSEIMDKHLIIRKPKKPK